MMNKSKIDWCDFTWNPVTGCRRDCEYCYARKQARRFSGDIRVNIIDKQVQNGSNPCTYVLAQPFKNSRGAVIPYPVGFKPTLHEYRLQDVQRKKKPATIFVCSMADLFAKDIPDEWIDRVFEACMAAPWHNYLFLTKCPERYADLAGRNKLPTARDHPNFWFGTTVTHRSAKAFTPAVTYNTFLSIEPITQDLEAGLGSFGGAAWIIVGAETGHRKDKITPERSWIENVVETAAITHTPVLMKDSKELRAVWGEKLIQQFPVELEPMPEDNSIPHCVGCEHCSEIPEGDRGIRRECEIGWETEGYDDRPARHILGRYTRSSPPWCPRRVRED